MKITKRQLRRIISEEIATVNDDAIEDVVMSVLDDEGGAAGLDPIEDKLEDLEDDEVSLPDEKIEDIIKNVAGVKRHAKGDFIDTTQLEGSQKMKITKKQLQKIIAEALEKDDYNVQAAINRASERGHSEDEIQGVLNSSSLDDEIITMLDKLGSEAYPAPSLKEE